MTEHDWLWISIDIIVGAVIYSTITKFLEALKKVALTYVPISSIRKLIRRPSDGKNMLNQVSQPIARVSSAVIAVGGFFSIVALSVSGTPLSGESLTLATAIVSGAVGFLFGNRESKK